MNMAVLEVSKLTMEDFVFARKQTRKRPFYLGGNPSLCSRLKNTIQVVWQLLTTQKILNLQNEVTTDQTTTFHHTPPSCLISRQTSTTQTQ